MLTTLIFGGVAAAFLFMSLGALFHQRWARRLPLLSAGDCDPSGAAPVRCSVVIAARDEQMRIVETVRHLQAQQGVEMEIIVVDDRSTDKTGEIVRKFTEKDPRARVIRVDFLPEGWLGKCHACHLGAQAATGEWILFTRVLPPCFSFSRPGSLPES